MKLLVLNFVYVLGVFKDCLIIVFGFINYIFNYIFIKDNWILGNNIFFFSFFNLLGVRKLKYLGKFV